MTKKIKEEAAPIEEVAARPGEKMYRLKIAGSRDNKEPVFIGVNGKTYVIKRDVDVEVPESVMEVLKNAVVTVREKAEQPDGNITMITRDVSRIPFMAMPLPV